MSGLPSPSRSAMMTPRPLPFSPSLSGSPLNGRSPASLLTSVKVPLPLLRKSLGGRPVNVFGGHTSWAIFCVYPPRFGLFFQYLLRYWQTYRSGYPSPARSAHGSVLLQDPFGKPATFV